MFEGNGRCHAVGRAGAKLSGQQRCGEDPVGVGRKSFIVGPHNIGNLTIVGLIEPEPANGHVRSNQWLTGGLICKRRCRGRYGDRAIRRLR